MDISFYLSAQYILRILFFYLELFQCALPKGIVSIIIVLGTNNILRYYNIQTLEHRLLVLIPSAPDDTDRGKFLHWNAYIAPIITRNINHITSAHTVLIYICYSVETCCTILFSIIMITSLFLEIEDKQAIDYIIISIAIIFMIFTALLFLWASIR